MVLTPKIIFWETTQRCNLKCHHCRMLKDNSVAELSTSEAFKLMHEIKDTFGSPLLVLSGGEPLLRKDIFEITALAARIGLPTALATNGVLLGEKEAGLLKEHRVRRVSLSLDSVDEKRHDAARLSVGAFQKTKTAAAILRQEGIPFQINFTITKNSIDEIRAVAQLAMSLGACAVHYFVLVPVGCGKEIEQAAMLGAEESEEALNIIAALAREFPLEIRPTCAPQYVRLLQNAAVSESVNGSTPNAHNEARSSNASSYSGCLAGTGTFFISAQGEVFPCGYLPVTAGSLRTNSIADIWNRSPVFLTLRTNEFKGACSSCTVRDKCRGCRARAYGLTGDYMYSDVTCTLASLTVSV